MKDANYTDTLKGVNPSGIVVPLKVSSSGELIVEYVANGVNASGNQSTEIDENYVTTNSAINSDNVYAVQVNSSGHTVINGLTIN